MKSSDMRGGSWLCRVVGVGQSIVCQLLRNMHSRSLRMSVCATHNLPLVGMHHAILSSPWPNLTLPDTKTLLRTCSLNVRMRSHAWCPISMRYMGDVSASDMYLQMCEAVHRESCRTLCGSN